MATKENPGAFDCHANAKPDEPMFILLARDPSGPAIVREWANHRRSLICIGAKPQTDMAMVDEALACADAMEAWRKEHWTKNRKVVDIDNYNRDYETEYLVAEHLTNSDARHIADDLNARFGDESATRFYTVFDDSRELYVFNGY